MSEPMLLSIVELGGYPDFTPLYRRLGYRAEKLHSVRKAQAWLKRNSPAVVVAEFHFDPELRDRMSNLESLLATLQRFSPQSRVLVFIERGHRQRLAQVEARFPLLGALDYPIEESALETLLAAVADERQNGCC
ncbi:MAG: hypothetical protein KDI68_16625 [Gammaproteobacteria bacterium]|nr:hypothetical protein [Gammaproteobacteria bacterium]